MCIFVLVEHDQATILPVLYYRSTTDNASLYACVRTNAATAAVAFTLTSSTLTCSLLYCTVCIEKQIHAKIGALVDFFDLL